MSVAIYISGYITALKIPPVNKERQRNPNPNVEYVPEANEGSGLANEKGQKCMWTKKHRMKNVLRGRIHF